MNEPSHQIVARSRSATANMETCHTKACFARTSALRPKILCAGRRSSRGGLHVVCGESRIGKLPVKLPGNVKTTLKGHHLQVEGPKGKLDWTLPEEVNIDMSDTQIVITRAFDTKRSKAMHGLARSLCNNMVVGVSEGFTIKLEMIGVGYRASVSGKQLTLNVGYCHPVIMDIPDGIDVEVAQTTEITATGYDKALLGNFCANIRRHRRPEPYKGKGIRYVGEVVRMKEGKKGK